MSFETKGRKVVVCEDCGMVYDYPNEPKSMDEQWDRDDGCPNCGHMTGFVYVGDGHAIIDGEDQ